MNTKKMMAGIKKDDGFLIPNLETGNGFLSIKNGKEYTGGMRAGPNNLNNSISG